MPSLPKSSNAVSTAHSLVHVYQTRPHPNTQEGVSLFATKEEEEEKTLPCNLWAQWGRNLYYTYVGSSNTSRGSLRPPIAQLSPSQLLNCLEVACHASLRRIMATLGLFSYLLLKKRSGHSNFSSSSIPFDTPRRGHRPWLVHKIMFCPLLCGGYTMYVVL